MVKKSVIRLPQSKPSELKPVEVVVSECFSFEDAVRKFKSLVQRERVIGQYKEKLAYEKPSIRKRRKRREAESAKFLANMREQQMASGEWDKKKKKKEQERMDKKSKKEVGNE